MTFYSHRLTFYTSFRGAIPLFFPTVVPFDLYLEDPLPLSVLLSVRRQTFSISHAKRCESNFHCVKKADVKRNRPGQTLFLNSSPWLVHLLCLGCGLWVDPAKFETLQVSRDGRRRTKLGYFGKHIVSIYRMCKEMAPQLPSALTSPSLIGLLNRVGSTSDLVFCWLFETPSTPVPPELYPCTQVRFTPISLPPHVRFSCPLFAILTNPSNHFTIFSFTGTL